MNSRTRPPESRIGVLIGTDCQQLLKNPGPHPGWPDCCRFLPVDSTDRAAAIWHDALRREAVHQDTLLCLFPGATPIWTADWHDQARYWMAAWSRRPLSIRCLSKMSLPEAAALAWSAHQPGYWSADSLMTHRRNRPPLHWQRNGWGCWSARDATSRRYGLGRYQLVRRIIACTDNRWPIWIGSPQGAMSLAWDHAGLLRAVSAMPEGLALYDDSLKSSHSASPTALSCQIPCA